MTLETGKLRARTPNKSMPPPNPTIEDIKEEIKLTKTITDTVKGGMLSGIVKIVFRSSNSSKVPVIKDLRAIALGV